MDVRNVKCHFKIEVSYLRVFIKQLDNTERKTKCKPTLCVIRLAKFVYVCFYNGCVNITGIRNLNGCESAVEYFSHELNLDKKRFGCVKIDNITATYKLHRYKIDLHTLCQLARRSTTVVNTKYNRELFPCAYLKTRFGTIIWSKSNAVSCVGMNSADDLKKLSTIIQQLSQNGVLRLPT